MMIFISTPYLWYSVSSLLMKDYTPKFCSDWYIYGFTPFIEDNKKLLTDFNIILC